MNKLSIEGLVNSRKFTFARPCREQVIDYILCTAEQFDLVLNLVTIPYHYCPVEGSGDPCNR